MSLLRPEAFRGGGVPCLPKAGTLGTTNKESDAFASDSLFCNFRVVPARGLEPLCLTARGPKPRVSTNFTTPAFLLSAQQGSNLRPSP